MTSFLRNAFLALVAVATLAVIVMMAVTAEAKHPEPGVLAAPASAADATR
jgi:hypothetical protein